MVSPKKLLDLARRWQRIAAGGTKRVPFLRSEATDLNMDYLAEKGHFVVYSTDQKRFEIPLKYSNCSIFQELFQMSEEEFGLSSDGPIMMPCESVFMEYIVSLVQRGTEQSIDRALLNSISPTSRCSLSGSSCQEQKFFNVLVYAY